MRNRHSKIDSNAEPLLGTIDDAQAILCVGRNSIYTMLNAGALKRVKMGGRSLITMASIHHVAKNGFRKTAA